MNSKTVQGSTVRTPTVKQNLTTLGTVRGRVGYSFLQNLLGFVSGGYAYGSGTLSTSIGNTGGCNGNYCAFSTSTGVKSGWTVGAGAEYAMTDSWMLRGEYLHYDLGSFSHHVGDPVFSTISATAKASFEGDIFRVGVGYKFN